MLNEKQNKEETLYVVEKHDKEYHITDIVERKKAHDNGVCHLTVIIVPFVKGGVHHGKWIVHDRTPKLWAKKKSASKELNLKDFKERSLNIFGGHCTVNISVKGEQQITEDFCRPHAKRELGEELYRRSDKNSGKKLEKWKNGKIDETEPNVRAKRYVTKEVAEKLISVGIAAYSAEDNVEYSYVFALPVPETDLVKAVTDLSKAETADKLNLIGADDYPSPTSPNGKQDVYLKLFITTEEKLKNLNKNNKADVEICDAITRLWIPENIEVHNNLAKIIASCA